MTKSPGHTPDWRPEPKTRTQISFVDIRRAYFNAKVDRELSPTYVDLPREDGDWQSHCGRILRHMYGTRMTADGWKEEYSTMLLKLGFKQGQACPNAFGHPERGITTSVHGDDSTPSGPNSALDWLEEPIVEAYAITIGPGSGPATRTGKKPEHSIASFMVR